MAAPPTFRRFAPQLAVAAGGDGGDGGGPPSRQLILSPQLRRAIELLQLSRRELIAEIAKELGTAPPIGVIDGGG